MLKKTTALCLAILLALTAALPAYAGPADVLAEGDELTGTHSEVETADPATGDEADESAIGAPSGDAGASSDPAAGSAEDIPLETGDGSDNAGGEEAPVADNAADVTDPASEEITDEETELPVEGEEASEEETPNEEEALTEEEEILTEEDAS